MRMVYRPAKYAVSFEWHGGGYIDIFSMTDDSLDPTRGTEGEYQRASASSQGAPFHSISVWDYGANKPSIPVTREGFIAECDEWLSDPANRRDYGIIEK